MANVTKRQTEAIIARRREIVSELLRNGYSVAEIQTKMGDEYMVLGETVVDNPYHFLNPSTDEPFSLSTIKEDCRQLVENWQAKAEADTSVWRGIHVERLEHIYRRSIETDNLGRALDVIREQSRILGTAKPQQSSVDHRLIITEEMKEAKTIVLEKLKKFQSLGSSDESPNLLSTGDSNEDYEDAEFE